jgi:hypothetical protein
MNIEPEILSVFVRNGWDAGMSVLAQARANKAHRDLATVSPMDFAQIAKFQEQIKIWEKEIPKIGEQVKAFVETPPATGKP